MGDTMSSKLFIGMPAYNDEKYIVKAIQSLKEQTYTNWVLFISDNCSTDKTTEIIHNYTVGDERIIHYIQRENIGLKNNFNYVFDVFIEDHDCSFFMWAPSNDLWEPTYIETCITLLGYNPHGGVAFTGMDNIDSHDSNIRDYPSFNRYSGMSKWHNTYKYLFEAEILGKCNMFLGVYRRCLILDIMSRTKYSIMASDYVIAIGIISHSHIIVSDEVLYHKREDSIYDLKSSPTKLSVGSIKNEVFPIINHFIVHYYYLKQVTKIFTKILVIFVFVYRSPRSIWSGLRRYVSLITPRNIRNIILRNFSIIFLNNYERFNPEKVDIGYGFAYSSSQITLPVNKLCIKIKTEGGTILKSIYETPHFSYISDYIDKHGSAHRPEESEYYNYKKVFFPDIDVSDQLRKFNTLADAMSKDVHNSTLKANVMIEKTFVTPWGECYAIVIDGAHRLSIIAAHGIPQINCKFVDKIEEYDVGKQN
jgi:glycosyltransferase involved in cell wall biosynthesis